MDTSSGRVGREREAAGRAGLRRRRHRSPGDPRKVLRQRDTASRQAQGARHRHDRRDDAAGRRRQGGLAEIMGAVAYLAAHPELEHAPIRVGFTVDEEVGRGVDHFDIESSARTSPTRSTAQRSADRRRDVLCVEVRSGSRAQRPSGNLEGQDGQRDQARGAHRRAAAARRRSPETTENYDGFVHPLRIAGTPPRRTPFIARDFDAQKLEEHESLLRGLADRVAKEEPRATVTVTVDESYRNMKEFLEAASAVPTRARKRRAARASSRERGRSAAEPTGRAERPRPTDPNIYTGRAPVPLRVWEWAIRSRTWPPRRRRSWRL